MQPFKKVTNDWFDYSSIGHQVERTSFIPFKVPLMPSIYCELPKCDRVFTVEDLVSKVSRIGLIIDLTCGHYYDPKFFRRFNIEHKKLFIPGHGELPRPIDVQHFFDVVTKFTAKSDKLIGVHCMHGVNRTGFMICKYMIEKLYFSPVEAIGAFANARGHAMERTAYIDDLITVNRM